MMNLTSSRRTTRFAALTALALILAQLLTTGAAAQELGYENLDESLFLLPDTMGAELEATTSDELPASVIASEPLALDGAIETDSTFSPVFGLFTNRGCNAQFDPGEGLGWNATPGQSKYYRVEWHMPNGQAYALMDANGNYYHLQAGRAYESTRLFRIPNVEGTHELKLREYYTQDVWMSCEFTVGAEAPQPPAPQPEPEPEGLEIRYLGNTGLCVDVKHSSDANGGNIWLWDCHSDDDKPNGSQVFAFEAQGNGVYQIRSTQSGKCLSTAGASKANKVNVHQWDCKGQANQLWRAERQFGSVYQLRNLESNRCLDADTSGKTRGTNLQQYSCNGTSAQQYRIEGLQ